jgi:hypothetical protein
MGAVLVLAMALLSGAAEPSAADQQNFDKAMLVTLQHGEVTANHGDELVINNARYSVLPSALITDDEGRQRMLKDFMPGTQVRFHVKQGSVDQLVMMLAR